MKKNSNNFRHKTGTYKNVSTNQRLDKNFNNVLVWSDNIMTLNWLKKIF